MKQHDFTSILKLTYILFFHRESDTWQCLLCMNFADIPESTFGQRKEGELSPKEKKIAERIVLELYCQYELSLPFREVIGPEVDKTIMNILFMDSDFTLFLQHTEYHSIIKTPMALDTIRQKLDWSSEEQYKNMEQLVRDVRLMFKNAYTYNAVSKVKLFLQS